MKGLLASHFDNPTDDTNLLVLADWLEEHGDDHLAGLVRMSMEGHTKANSSDWNKRLTKLQQGILSSGKLPDHLRLTDHGFQIPDSNGMKRNYVVDNRGIWLEKHMSDGGIWHTLINPSEWTESLVKAAILSVVKHLNAKPMQRYEGEDTSYRDRPGGLTDRQLYQAMVKYGKILHELSQQVQTGAIQFQEPSASAYMHRTTEPITEFLYNLLRNTPPGLSKKYPHEYQDIMDITGYLASHMATTGDDLPRRVLDVRHALETKK
jgi:uncharacterized protein (TIGR02996 family)